MPLLLAGLTAVVGVLAVPAIRGPAIRDRHEVRAAIVVSATARIPPEASIRTARRER